MTFRVSLEGSGPGCWTGMAGKSLGSKSAPMGLTFELALGIGGVGVVEVAGVAIELLVVVMADPVGATVATAALSMVVSGAGASLMISARSRCTATFWGSLSESG